MAKKVEITLDVKGNIEATTKNLKELKKQLKETAAGSNEFKNLTNQIDDLEDKLKGSKQAAGDWVDQLAAAPGPLGMIGGALNKAKLATVSFSSALKAAGIGLIVSLVAGLAAAFSQSEEAGKKLQPLLIGFQRIFNGIFRALEPLFNTLIELATQALPYVTKAFGVAYSAMSSFLQGLGQLGKAIGKLISGDFAGAWDDAKKSVTEFGDRYEEANKRFISGTQEVTQIEKEELEKRKEEEKKKLEERLRKQEEYRKKVEEANRTADKKLLDLQNEFAVLTAKNDAEANRIKLKQDYDAQLKEINQLLISEKRKGELREELTKVYNAKVKKLREDEIKAASDELTNFYNEQSKANKDLIKLAEDLTAAVIEDETVRAKEVLRIQYERQVKEIQNSKASKEQRDAALKALEKKYQTDIENIEDDAAEKKKAKDIKAIDDQLRILELRGQVLGKGTQEYFDNQEELLRQAYEKEKMLAQGNADLLLAIEKKYQQDKKNLKQQEIAAYGEVAAATIASFAAVTGALAQGYDEEAKTSRTAFEQRKRLQRATAVMSAASGIIQILTQPSTLPSPFDWIVKVANAAALGITTAVQIGNINKTKFEGGAGTAGTVRGMARGGFIEGNRHTEGGVMINAEGGEAVMTRGAVSMFGPMLSMMNQAGGGATFNKDMMFTANDAPSSSSTNDQSTPVIMKTYVVSNELTTEMEKQARLKNLSTL